MASVTPRRYPTRELNNPDKKEFIMNRKKMIQAAIGLMGLAASFLPQQVLAAYCKADCGDLGSCSASGENVFCACLPGPVCFAWSSG